MNLVGDPLPQSESQNQNSAESIVNPDPIPVVEPSVDEPTLVTKPLDAEQPTAESAPAEPTPPPGLVYTVQQGETLWGIAKKFGTTIEAVVRANALEDHTHIRAGQKLVIPR